MKESFPFITNSPEILYKHYFFIWAVIILLGLSIFLVVLNKAFKCIFGLNNSNKYDFSIFKQKIQFLKSLGYEIENHREINKKLRQVYQDLKKNRLDDELSINIENQIFPENFARRTQEINFDIELQDRPINEDDNISLMSAELLEANEDRQKLLIQQKQKLKRELRTSFNRFDTIRRGKEDIDLFENTGNNDYENDNDHRTFIRSPQPSEKKMSTKGLIGKSFARILKRRLSIDSSQFSHSRAALNLVKEVKRHHTNKDVRTFLPIFMKNSLKPPKNYILKMILSRILLGLSVLAFLLIFNLASGFGLYPLSLTLAINLFISILVVIKHLGDQASAEDNLVKTPKCLTKFFSYEYYMETIAEWCHSFNEFSICCFFSLFTLTMLSFLFSITFKSVCVTNSHSYIGIKLDEFTLSTQLMRMFEIRAGLSLLDPCYVYITLPRFTHSSAFVNVLIKADGLYNLSRLYYDEKSYFHQNGFMRNRKDNKFKRTFGGDEGSRDIYTFLIDSLDASTEYTFMLNINGLNYSECANGRFGFNYRTLPGSWSNPGKVNYIVAGNIGATSKTKRQIELIKTMPNIRDLDLFVLGGNIAKDNGCNTCRFLWDEIIISFSEINNITNRIIPFIMAVGEFDVGYPLDSTLTYWSLVDDLSQLPMYLVGFPQHLNSSTEIPSVIDRSSYFVHFFGQFSLITLDSGCFFNSSDPNQINFLKSILESVVNSISIVIYSGSIYPSCVSENDSIMSNASRETLVQIFDQYKVNIVFEHGSRYFKRTKPLRAGLPTIIENGTIYLGDGNFGGEIPICDGTQLSEDLFEKRSPDNHFWWVQESEDFIEFRAYNIEGEQIDILKLPSPR